MEIERENVILGLPENVFCYSHVVEETCETLEPVVDVSIPSFSARGNLAEDSSQWEFGAERNENPFENLLVMQQNQALNRKNSSEIAEDTLMISTQKNDSSSVISEASTPVVCEMRNESGGSTVTDISYTINTGNVNCEHPTRDAIAARRGRGTRRGRQTAKARPAHNSVTVCPVPLAPAHVFSPSLSALPAHPVSRQGKPPLPKPLPEPPKGVDFLMVRRHLDDVLQKIITKVARRGRKRNQTTTPHVASTNIVVEDTSESVNKRPKPLHPSVPILETNGKIAETKVNCSVVDQSELERSLALHSGPDENLASMHNQSSVLHSSSVNVDIMKLSRQLLERLHAPQVLEVNATTANVTALSGGEGKRETSHDVRLSTESHKSLVDDEATIDRTGGLCPFVVANSDCPPLNTDDSFLSEQNLVQKTSTLKSNTPSNVHINKPARSSFPPFNFPTLLSHQSLSTARTSSPRSTLNTDDYTPLNSDDSYLSENNLVQITSALQNDTAQKICINKAARSSFPPFNFSTSLSGQSLSTARTSSQSAFNIPITFLASRGRVSAPMLEAGSALQHFTFEVSKFEMPTDHNSIPPKHRHSEETTQLLSESIHHDGMPATSTTHNSSAISGDSRCQDEGEPGNGSPEPTVTSAMMPASPTVSLTIPEAPVSPIPQEISVPALTGDVSPVFQEDSDCSSLNALMPPGNNVPPTEPKLIPPWRRSAKAATKLSNLKSDKGTPVASSTSSSGDNVDETRRSRKGKVLATAKNCYKIVQSGGNDCAPVCDLCGRGFSSFCQLTSHVRLHTASARCFFCSLCKQRFLHLDALAAHARRRHDVKLTSPEGSGKSSVQLQRPFAYSCSVCEEVFEGRSTLVKHLLSQHSAPSSETVQRIAPALLVATRMRGTAWCKPLSSSNTDTSRQSRGDTIQTPTSSDHTDQASVHSGTNISQSVDKTLERSPSPIAVHSRSNTPLSSKSTISPPNSPLSVNSVLELSEDLVSSEVSCTVNLDNSHLHVTQKHTQLVSKLDTSCVSVCPIHPNSSTQKIFSISFDSSASKDKSTIKPYAKETTATLANLPPSSIKNSGVTVHDENFNEGIDIMDSSSVKVSSQNSSIQSIQKVSKTPCPVHNRMRSSSSQNKITVKNSCPIHQQNRTPFSDESILVSLLKEQPNVPLEQELISPSKSKLKSFLQSRGHSNAPSQPMQKKSKNVSSCVDSKSPASCQVTKSLKKSMPHSSKCFPKANAPLDSSSSFTSPGKGFSSCVSADEHFEPVIILERIDDIESITVE